jgi:DNA polymerase III delta prime subunit
MSARDMILELKKRMGESIIGQEAVIGRLLIALLANGHVFMEGLPGLAKTRTIKTLAKNLEADFSRIQFTPDLLPSDVTGTEVYYDEGGKGSFKFQQGPVFGNLILADEINRAPAKAQAALLEAMEERQVTVQVITEVIKQVAVPGGPRTGIRYRIGQKVCHDPRGHPRPVSPSRWEEGQTEEPRSRVGRHGRDERIDQGGNQREGPNDPQSVIGWPRRNPKPALRRQPILDLGCFSGNGCSGERRHDQARHVRGQPPGLPGV